MKIRDSHHRLHVVLLSALLAALLGGIGTGRAFADTESSRTRQAVLIVNARVLPTLKVANLVYPRQLAVSQADVDRGYVDIDGESSVQVLTNHRAGVSLSAQAQDPVITSVQLRAAVGHLSVDASSANVHVPVAARERQTVNIAYRLFLAATAQPGQYRWPAALSVSQ